MLQIHNLQISIAGRALVHNTSITIAKGSTTAIVGESGSGKSLTALSIMGLLSKEMQVNGKILFNGQNLLAADSKALNAIRGKAIAMIFQEPMTSLNPVLTCGSQVAESMVNHLGYTKVEAKAATIRLFEEVQLPRVAEMYDQYPHQLSGGQKQRVMIAMALACNPELIIADEPTTALDVTVQRSIVDLLEKIQKDRGMSLLFISHDLGLVHHIADNIVVMHQGQVIEQGSAKAIFENAEMPYTKGLIASKPSVNRELFRLPTIKDFTDAPHETVETIYKKFEKKPAEITTNVQPLMLDVKGLSKHYVSQVGIFKKNNTTVKAVNEVSFSIQKGEIVGLVGESGCGKTTLSRCLLGLIKPTAGQIIINGTDISKLNTKALNIIRQKAQIIFQDPYSSLNPRISIGQAIKEPMQVHGILENDKARTAFVYELLELVGLLPEHYSRYPHEFSGGQRQRIVIARTLALKPEFIIADESVSALDVSVQAQILNLLADLRDRLNLTYLFISHDLSVVHHLCHRVLIMQNGEIVESNTTKNIFENAENAYTQKLLGAMY